MNTFKEFEQQLENLIDQVGIKTESMGWKLSKFTEEVKSRFITKCIVEANIYHVEHVYLPLTEIWSLDDLTIIKDKIDTHFENKEKWKKRRLEEVRPYVGGRNIVNEHRQEHFWPSTKITPESVEQARDIVEQALLKNFKVKSSTAFNSAIRDLRTFLKLAIDYDLIYTDENLCEDLNNNPDIDFKIFKETFHFKFKDKTKQKQLVKAYLDLVDISNFI